MYVTGRCNETWNGPTGQSPLNPHSGYGRQMFVLKLDNDGVYVWHTFYGGVYADYVLNYGFDIAIDADDNVYITGFSYATWSSPGWNGPNNEPPLNAYQGEPADVVVLKLNSEGAYQWHTFYGSVNTGQGVDGDQGRGIIIQGSSVYVALFSECTWDGPGSAAPLHAYSGGDADLGVLKLDTAGAYQWHTFYGSEGFDEVHEVGVDGNGNIYMVGESDTTWNGPTGQSPLHAYSGNGDVAVVKLNNSGEYQWHTFYGSATAGDACRAISLDESGNIYLTGNSRANWQGPNSANPINPYNGTGAADIMIMKLNNTGGYLWHTFWGAASDDDYSNDVVLDAADNVIVAGRSSTAWLGATSADPLHPFAGGRDIMVMKVSTDGDYKWHTFYGSAAGSDMAQRLSAYEGSYYITGRSNASWLGDDDTTPLHAYTGEEDVFVLTLEDKTGQQITIPQGWSYISTYLDPADPAVENMMAEIVGDGNLTIMLGDGGIYAPDPFFINTLGNWNVNKGYKVKMSTEDILMVDGSELGYDTLAVPAGQYLIPVLSSTSKSLDNVFEDPENDILYLVDIYSNKVYWPGGEITTLTDLVPGKGYLGQFINDVVLDFSAKDNVAYNPKPASAPAAGPWACVRTMDFHLISLSGQAMANLNSAHYIGAFDVEGNCIGYTAMKGQTDNTLLTVYGDDEFTTAKDGAGEGEHIFFRSYNATNNFESGLTAVYSSLFPNHNGLFASNGLSGITDFKESATGINDAATTGIVQIYPNPATDIFKIQVRAGEVVRSISIRSVNGVLIRDIQTDKNNLQISISDLQKGIYYIELKFSASIVVRKIAVM
nr:SBBP repeat-containing protein [Bacteroidota bacterium]